MHRCPPWRGFVEGQGEGFDALLGAKRSIHVMILIMPRKHSGELRKKWVTFSRSAVRDSLSPK